MKIKNQTKLFTWQDFTQFEGVPPETLADYVNQLLLCRSTPLQLDDHWHDVIRTDAGWSEEYLELWPNKARMIKIE